MEKPEITEYQNPADLLKQMKADEQTQALPPTSPPPGKSQQQQDYRRYSTSVKQARLKAHQDELEHESPEDLLMRYGVKPGDAKGLVMQLLNVISGDEYAAPKVAERYTADEFRSKPQRFRTAPKK